MKKILLLASLCVAPAFAEVRDIPVVMQCGVLGPQYEGIFRIDRDIRNWQPTSGCQFGWKKFSTGEIELRVNNLVYKAKPETNFPFTNTGTCELGGIDLRGFSFFEQRTGYEIMVQTNAASLTVPQTIQFLGNEEYCNLRFQE